MTFENLTLSISQIPYASLIFSILGFAVAKNDQIATIANWGPEYRVAVDINVQSSSSDVWGSIIRFTATGGDCCNLGDRVPAIFYNSERGIIRISSQVDENGDFYPDYDINLGTWYHIEIVQENNGGKVRLDNRIELTLLLLKVVASVAKKWQLGSMGLDFKWGQKWQ